jgi:hypothetical protein
MHGILDASAQGTYYNLKSTCTRPEPLMSFAGVYQAHAVYAMVKNS